jgi:hypothetical protein
MKLGTPVRDVITGFRGIVWARTEYFTGCDQVAIKPTDLDKDGNTREVLWVDESRVSATGEVSPDVATVLNKTRPDPGGPQDVPMGRSD